jgi:mannose-6-phosphate isomerase-like protein (cupin superfamily)
VSTQTSYDIHTDIRYAPLEKIEAGAIADQCTEKWWNQTLCKVNESVARIGVFDGEFHWHKHDNEDEFFFVVDGRLIIDLEDRSVELLPKQGFTIPKGVVHRTRAPVRTAMLMVEGRTVTPTGDG